MLQKQVSSLQKEIKGLQSKLAIAQKQLDKQTASSKTAASNSEAKIASLTAQLKVSSFL